MNVNAITVAGARKRNPIQRIVYNIKNSSEQPETITKQKTAINFEATKHKRSTGLRSAILKWNATAERTATPEVDLPCSVWLRNLGDQISK